MSGPTSPPLDRRLGPLDGAAIVVSNVIGGGIFFVPIIVAQLVPDPTWILLLWGTGGVLALAGALAYAELAALLPRSGGEYVYLREAFGSLAGFLSGWTSFVAGFSGAIAAGSLALADYVGRFIPGAADATPIVAIGLPWVSLVVSRRTIVALTAIAALSIVHLRGLGPGRLVQNALAGLKVSALVVFVALGLTLGRRVPAAVVQGPAAALSTGLLLALIPVMFTYSGWNAATYVAEEVRTPERNVPLALALGTTTVVVIYLGLNALYLQVLPPAALAGLSGRLADEAADRLFGAGIGDLVGLFAIVSMAASLSAMTLAGPRVYFAMANDGLFPSALARVHPRARVPAVAIVSQSIWSGVLVVSGSLSQLVSYTGFAIVLFSGAAVAALFVLRRRMREAERPFRAWGYPWAPLLFVAVSAAMLGNEMWRNPGTSAAGLAVIAVGVPIHAWMRRDARPREERPIP